MMPQVNEFSWFSNFFFFLFFIFMVLICLNFNFMFLNQHLPEYFNIKKSLSFYFFL